MAHEIVGDPMPLSEVPDGAFFTRPDLPHRCLMKHWNLMNGAVAATNEDLGLLCLKGDMPAVLIERTH